MRNKSTGKETEVNNYQVKLNVYLSLFITLFFFTFTGCQTEKGMFVPLVGTSYDYSYLNSLEGGKLGEPLGEVIIKDENAAKKLYGSIEAAEIFESYFPDGVEGGKELDRWWKSPFKTLRSDKDIIKTIRYAKNDLDRKAHESDISFTWKSRSET